MFASRINSRSSTHNAFWGQGHSKAMFAVPDTPWSWMHRTRRESNSKILSATDAPISCVLGTGWRAASWQQRPNSDNGQQGYCRYTGESTFLTSQSYCNWLHGKQIYKYWHTWELFHLLCGRFMSSSIPVREDSHDSLSLLGYSVTRGWELIQRHLPCCLIVVSASSPVLECSDLTTTRVSRVKAGHWGQKRDENTMQSLTMSPCGWHHVDQMSLKWY